MNGYISRLIVLGYSHEAACNICALHLSNGTLDILQCFIEAKESEK